TELRIATTLATGAPKLLYAAADGTVVHQAPPLGMRRWYLRCVTHTAGGYGNPDDYKVRWLNTITGPVEASSGVTLDDTSGKFTCHGAGTFYVRAWALAN